MSTLFVAPMQAHPSAHALGRLLPLGLQIAAAQLAPLLLGIYVARLIASLGGIELSAYSLVSGIAMTAFVAGSSMLQSLYVIGGRAVGHGEHDRYRDGFFAGLQMACALTLLCAAVACAVGPLVRQAGFDPGLAALAATYGQAVAVEFVPAFALLVLRIHAALAARAAIMTAVSLLATVGAALAATWVAAAPPFAWLGAGGSIVLAVGLVNGAALFVAALLMVLTPSLRLKSAPMRLVVAARAGRRMARRGLVALGWPIGVIVFLDSLVFASASLMISRSWLAAMPAHAVACLWIALGLAFPTGLAQSAMSGIATLPDKYVTERWCVARTALLLAAAYGVAATAVMTLCAEPLGRLLLPAAALDADGAHMLRTLMGLGGAALGLQSVIIVAAGLLRGAGSATAPLKHALFGYGVIGIGGEFLLSHAAHLGAPGVWGGLLTGFALTAAAVSYRCLATFRPSAQSSPLTANPSGATP